MDENVTIIPWNDILSMVDQDDHGSTYRFNGVDLLEAPQRARAASWFETQKLITSAIEDALNGTLPLYFRVTAGSKAGTIMRLNNPEIARRHDRNAVWLRHYGTLPAATTKPQLHKETTYTELGYFEVDGHLYFPSHSELVFKVDGQEKIISFDRQNSSNKTMKPELLLGYMGPTVWKYGKPTKKSISLIDRFGREINVGDVVLLGRSDNGRLITGKITRISDARGVWIKHIGSKVDHYEKSCDGNQIMLLKDIEKVLMMEKLKSL